MKSRKSRMASEDLTGSHIEPNSNNWEGSRRSADISSTDALASSSKLLPGLIWSEPAKGEAIQPQLCDIFTFASNKRISQLSCLAVAKMSTTFPLVDP